MKIVDIKADVYLREQPSWATFGRDLPPPVKKVPFGIIRITTDEGIEGFSMAPPEIAKAVVRGVKPQIVGKDPFDREWIWQRLWYLCERARHGSIPLLATSATDIALWDIAGKALGIPIYKLMGAYREKIPIYASSWGKSSVNDYAVEVIACKKRGLSGYKIHPGTRSAEKIIEICRATREAGGNDMKLMLDVAGCLEREDAYKVGKELDKLNFYWFEEPIPDYDIEGLIKLREKLDTPICATESNQLSLYGIPEYLLRRAVDIVRCDTWLSGGITPAKKIADMCNAFGMKCEIHASFPTSSVANLHVECSMSNSEYHEMIWPEVHYGLKAFPELDEAGYLHVPNKPGLGIEIDLDSLGESIDHF